MGEEPDALEASIRDTRSRLDEDIDRLGNRLRVARESVAIQAQWWVGVGAVAAGLIGAVWLWPRHG